MARPSLPVLAVALCIAMTACSGQQNQGADQPQPQAQAEAPDATDSASPFAEPSTLPLHAPDFSKIKDSDYQPGFEQAMEQQLVEVQKIAGNPDAPTFDNTLVALEKSGQMLSRVNMAFNAVTSANTNDALQKVQETVAPELAATSDAIYLDKMLFERIKTVYDQRDTLKLDPESQRLLEWTHDEFVHNGANLSDADKAKLKDLNKEESTLSTAFVSKLLAATKAGALVVDDKAKLAGLSDAGIQAAAQDAEGRDMAGKWLLPLQNTTQQPALTNLTDRDVRQALFEHSYNHRC